MRNNLNIFLFVFSLAIICRSGLYAQSSCGAPISICNNPALMFTSVGGTGLVPGMTTSNPLGMGAPSGTNTGCMYSYVPNPEWFLINVTSSGNLGFAFGAAGSANPQSAPLHWIMWPYNATTCTNIFNNTLPPVSCNFNFTFSGGTGMGTVPPFGNIGNYQPSIPVLQGEQYLICISNGTSVTPTAISFTSTGTAGISCNPLTIPNTTACPCQPTVVAASWLGATAVTYTLISPAPGGGTITQSSPNFTVSKCGPAATHVYTVFASGTNQYGQPITATQNFTLTINPTAPIAVAHAINYCYGTCADIVITPAAGSFSMAGPSTSIPSQPSNTITLCNLIAANNGNYTVTAQLNTGCIGTQNIQINVAPNNFISTQQSTVAACQNGFAQLTATLVGANSYTWTGPGNYSVVVGPPVGAPAPNGNVVIANIQPTAAGVYTVQSNINFNGITCLRQNTVMVTVVQVHTVATTPSFTYCQGASIVLTGSTTNAQAYSWAGPVPQGVFYTSQTTPSVSLTNSATPVPHQGTYIFTAYFTDGVANCPVSSNVNITVVAVNPVIVLVPPQGLICQYNTANLAVSAVGATSFTWTGPCGFTSTLQTPVIPNMQPGCSGFYTVVADYQNGTVVCPATGFAQITVIPVNSITVVPDVVTCYPGNAGLYSSAVGATSYSWAGPNSYTAGTANTVIYYAPLSASGIYTVTTTFTTGGLTCMNTNTVSVSVNPIISFTLPSHIQVCPNGSISLNGPPGAVSYTWTSSVPLASTIPVNNQGFSVTGMNYDQSGTYALSVSSTGSCVSTRSVEVDVLTPISYTLPVQSRTLCLNDPPVRLEIGATGGSQVYAYNWFPGSYLSSPTGSVVYSHPLGTTVYNVTAYDVACPNYTISHIFTLLVKLPPQPIIILDKSEGCEPFCIGYNPKTKSEAAITTYDFGGVIKSQGDSLHVCLDPGTYTMKVISEGFNGCIGTVEYPVPIVVFPKSHSDITWTPDLPTTTENLVTFNPVPKYGNVVAQSWMFSGTGMISEDTTDEKYPQRKYDNTGKFPIMLISVTDKGCIDTTVKFIEIKDELNVFIPNSFTPNNDGMNDLFMIKGLGFKVESFMLDIFDRWGHSIYSTKDINKGWDGTIKGTAPMEGVYVYRVRIIGANGEGRKEYIGHVTLLK